MAATLFFVAAVAFFVSAATVATKEVSTLPGPAPKGKEEEDTKDEYDLSCSGCDVDPWNCLSCGSWRCACTEGPCWCEPEEEEVENTEEDTDVMGSRVGYCIRCGGENHWCDFFGAVFCPCHQDCACEPLGEYEHEDTEEEPLVKCNRACMSCDEQGACVLYCEQCEALLKEDLVFAPRCTCGGKGRVIEWREG